jgi:hypothetical protein
VENEGAFKRQRYGGEVGHRITFLLNTPSS